MAKLYSRINWVDYPSVTTPMNATNLNKMDKGIDDLDNSLNDLTTDLSDLTTVVANHATYSTTEEVVIGTYDGKPLYRSCLSIESLPNMTSTSYPHGIANIEKIFIGNNSHAIAGTNCLPLPFTTIDVLFGIGVYPNPTNVVVDTGMDRRSLSAKVFLEYTKTTD